MKRPLQLPLAIALALGATNAFALGLGTIHVNSKLNQPLDAEIPVLQGTQGEAEGLLVQLAAAEDFDRVGLNRSRLSVPLEFTLVKSPHGEMVIKVTSKEVVREPFLDGLAEHPLQGGPSARELVAGRRQSAGGLGGFRSRLRNLGLLGQSIDLVAKNTRLRERQVESLTDAVRRATHPVLIAGDTNLPTLSWLYHHTLGALGVRDAFDEAGSGFGYTFPAKVPWMLAGMLISWLARSMAATASPSDFPASRLNDSVIEGKNPWWFTASEVEPGTYRAISLRGTGAPCVGVT